MISNQPTYIQHVSPTQPSHEQQNHDVESKTSPPPCTHSYLLSQLISLPTLVIYRGWIPGCSLILYIYMKLATIQSLPPPPSLTVRPWKKGNPKRKLIFQPSIFKGYVKLPGNISNLYLGIHHKYIHRIQRGNCDWDLNLAHEPEVFTSNRRLEW